MEGMVCSSDPMTDFQSRSKISNSNLGLCNPIPATFKQPQSNLIYILNRRASFICKGQLKDRMAAICLGIDGEEVIFIFLFLSEAPPGCRRWVDIYE